MSLMISQVTTFCTHSACDLLTPDLRRWCWSHRGALQGHNRLWDTLAQTDQSQLDRFIHDVWGIRKYRLGGHTGWIGLASHQHCEWNKLGSCPRCEQTTMQWCVVHNIVTLLAVGLRMSCVTDVYAEHLQNIDLSLRARINSMPLLFLKWEPHTRQCLASAPPRR